MNNTNKNVFPPVPHIFIKKNQHVASRFCITDMDSLVSISLYLLLKEQASLTGCPMTLVLKSSSQLRIGPVRPLFGQQFFFFFEVSAQLDVRHCPKCCNPVQYQGKLMM